MPFKAPEREYRALAAPLAVPLEGASKRIESDFYVEGYASTFTVPYLLFEDVDGTKYYECVDRNALVGCDMSDVIMMYNHESRVYARQSNGSLIVEPNDKGIFIAADLSRTALAQSLYEDIKAGMLTKMSWAFTIDYANGGDTWEDTADGGVLHRICKVKKMYDVSAVNMPADNDTDISARSLVKGRTDLKQLEQLEKRKAILELKTKILTM